MTRSTLALVLSLTAVFVCGALVGGFGYHACTREDPAASASREQPRRSGPDEMRRRFVSTMKRHLDLNETQIMELNAILDRTEERVQALDARTRPEKQAIMEKQVKEINSILTAQQREEYQKLLDQVAEQRRKARKDNEKRRRDP
jgi:hypothetical protein